MAKQIEVLTQRTDDGRHAMVVFTVHAPDGQDMTAQQVLEAIAEALLLHWDNAPIEQMNIGDFDS